MSDWLNWCQVGVRLVYGYIYWSSGFWLPGVHALHQDLVLFTLHHIIGEHGVKVWDGGRQNDPVSAELMIPNLQRRIKRRKYEYTVYYINCSHLYSVVYKLYSPVQRCI